MVFMGSAILARCGSLGAASSGGWVGGGSPVLAAGGHSTEASYLHTYPTLSQAGTLGGNWGLLPEAIDKLSIPIH